VAWEEIEKPQDSAGQSPLSRVFEVTDAVSFLPFGLYDTTVKVRIEFANFEHGVVITKYAILGLVFRETWTVESGAHLDNPESEGRVLSLSVEMSGNPITVPAFRSMMEKNHLMYLEKVIERAIAASEQDSQDSRIVGGK
jgi:hypothetical protein